MPVAAKLPGSLHRRDSQRRAHDTGVATSITASSVRRYADQQISR